MQSMYSMLAIWVIIGIICSFVAKSKGKNQYLWFAIGVLFSVLGLLILLLLPKKEKEKVATPSPAVAKSMNSEAALPADDEENFMEPTPPVKRIKQDTALQWHYIYESDTIVEVRGPFNIDDLRKEFVNLKLPISTYIWCDEFADWTPLSEFQNMSYLTDPELIIEDTSIPKEEGKPEAKETPTSEPPPHPKNNEENQT